MIIDQSLGSPSTDSSFMIFITEERDKNVNIQAR